MGQANFGQGNLVVDDCCGGAEDGQAWIPASRPGFSRRTFPCPKSACPEKRRSGFPWLSFSGLRTRPFCCCPDGWLGGRRRAVEDRSDTLRHAAPVARWIPSETHDRPLSASAEVLSQAPRPEVTHSELRKRPPSPAISQARSFCHSRESSPCLAFHNTANCCIRWNWPLRAQMLGSAVPSASGRDCTPPPGCRHMSADQA